MKLRTMLSCAILCPLLAGVTAHAASAATAAPNDVTPEPSQTATAFLSGVETVPGGFEKLMLASTRVASEAS